MSKEVWKIKKAEVLIQLPLLDVTQLTQLCVELDIDVPPAKKGNSDSIFNLINRHITSETVEISDDHGLALFTDVDARVKGMLQLKFFS